MRAVHINFVVDATARWRDVDSLDASPRFIPGSIRVAHRDDVNSLATNDALRYGRSGG
jgi:hypothetical protein